MFITSRKLFFCFQTTLFVLACVYPLLYVGSAIFRLSYPYELTNYEFEAFIQVQRLLDNKQIYTAPSLEYVPMMYTPLYYYLSALFAKYFGETLATLRTVSFIASIGVMYILYLFAKRETGSRMFGVVAMGVFAALYIVGGKSYEVARVDSLALFFFIAALYLSRFGSSYYHHFIAAVLMVFSIFTKQTYLFTALALVVYYYVFRKTYFLIYTVTFIVSLILAILWFQVNTDGWFFYYALFLPIKHRFYNPILLRVVQVIVVLRYFFALNVITLYIVYYLGLLKREKGRFVFLLSIPVSVISVASILKLGGSNNVLFPLFVMVSLLFALSMHATGNLILHSQSYNKKVVLLTLFLVNLATLALLFYNPSNIISRDNVRMQYWEELINLAKKEEGEVFIPEYPLVGHMAGKRPVAHIDLVGDLLGASGDRKPSSEGLLLIEHLQQRIKDKEYQMILFSKQNTESLLYLMIKSNFADNYAMKRMNLSLSNNEVIIYTPK